MKKSYRIAKKTDTRDMAGYLAPPGEHLLPVVELIETARIAVGEMSDRLGRANLEAVLQLSAGKVAGEKHRGSEGGEIARHGSQPGTVCPGEHKVRVNKPRLRRKGRGKGAEVEIPAYEAMNGGEGRVGRDIHYHSLEVRTDRTSGAGLRIRIGLSAAAVKRPRITPAAPAMMSTSSEMAVISASKASRANGAIGTLKKQSKRPAPVVLPVGPSPYRRSLGKGEGTEEIIRRAGRAYQGVLRYLEKSGSRLACQASRPSRPSSVE